MSSNLSKILASLMVVMAILTGMPSRVGHADSSPRPDIAVPFEGELVTGESIESILSFASVMTLLSGDVFQDGADRLASLQNNDGGWDWPLNDGNPASISPKNTLGPIGQGLADAYRHTSDSDHLSALLDAGTLLLSKTNTFSPSDGYLAATLDDLLGGSTYTNHIISNYYGPLAAGTYDRNGADTNLDTTEYVNLIRTSRSGSQANLAAWDLGIGLVGAAAVGADTSAWIAGVEAEINELNSNNYYDVIGLAGALYGMASVGEEFNPSTGSHAAAESIADLGIILADYQLATGGFTWNAGYQGEGQDNESIQETAYAILALDQLDQTAYMTALVSAANYTKSVQLGTGGWESYTGGGENNEITGEALWAIHTTYSFQFNGFFQPVDMTAVNNAKAGQTIPVKWQLLDADGAPISDPASFVKLFSYSVNCGTLIGDPVDAIEEYAAGASGLQYQGDGNWQFNWKTPKSYTNTCRAMYVEFQGGFKSPVVTFKFK